MSTPSMSFEDFTRLVLDALEAAKIDYMIGGSVGLLAWGEPRTTRDFDLVVNLPPEQIYALSKELEQRDMLVPWEVLLDLLLQAEGDLPVNAIHLYTGFKAELFLLRPEDTFRAAALARRRLVDIGPPLGTVYVHAPEDLIIYKLRYYQLSQQPKHIRDIQSILKASGAELDYAYLEQWITYFNLSSPWYKAQHWNEVG
ncbi:MAG: hypothetical protein U0350_16025 [Caldilineaceae bacterium]